MSLKKDKSKVLGETFDDDRIKTFLTVDAPSNVNPDYHCLETAYRGMHQENFATFVGFFKDAGRDLNAKGPEGKSLAQIVASHRKSSDYLQVLTAHGAC